MAIVLVLGALILPLDRERIALAARRTELAASVAARAEPVRAVSDANDFPPVETTSTLVVKKEPAVAPTPEPAPTEASPGTPLVLGVDQWRNAGTATPEAAFETALWAAGRGDWAVLRSTIRFEPGARKVAADFFGTLPESLQTQFGSPEGMAAALTLPQVPLAPVTLERLAISRDGQVFLQVVLSDTRKQSPDASRRASFGLVSTDQGWRLVLPRTAIERLVGSLKEPTVP